MDLSVQKQQSPSFGLKFYRNKNLEEVVLSEKRLQNLDQAFNKLLHIEGGDIVIIHGINKEGKIFSTFTLGRNSVQNNTAGYKTPIEATKRAILELIDPENSKLTKLLGGKKPKVSITENDIFSRYTTK
ncbi:hypothetical protein IJ541_11200 [bacterium]|nr:hypothetical protein [bacterium]